MGSREERKRRLQEMAELSMQEAEELLSNELQTLMDATSVDLEKLRPDINDDETYEKVIAIVKEVTDKNFRIAQLKGKLELLGKDAVKVGKKIVKLL